MKTTNYPILITALLILLAYSSGTVLGYNTIDSGYDISGHWKMVGNVAFEFDLELQQSGDQITGTMTRTNGDEPIDQISGTVSSEGQIQFTRERAGEFTQVYIGQVSGSGDSMTIEGTYDHNGQGSYPWSAERSQSSSTAGVLVDVYTPESESHDFTVDLGISEEFVPNRFNVSPPTLDETAQGTTSLEVDGSALQDGAALGNSEEAKVLVNVSKSFISSGPMAIGAISLVTGLQASSFIVETMRVPPYGANVKIVGVSEERPGSYTLTIIPESYQGTQYTWLEGTYQLRITVSAEGITGWADIPLVIFSRPVAAATSFNLTGIWVMSGNVDYRYNLDLLHSGNRIAGNITRTNGHEPIDEVNGTVSADGKVEFTRERAGDFTQFYTGQLSGSGDALIMEGTFTHNHEGQYPWNATLATRERLSVDKSWSASWKDFLAGFGLRTQTYIDPADKKDTFLDWSQDNADLKSTFKWTGETSNVAHGVWQVSVLPFPIGEKNWSSPPGLVASGILSPDQQEFDIDFGLFTPSKQVVGAYWKNTRPYLEFEKVAIESIKGQISTEMAKPEISDEAKDQLNQVLGLVDQASNEVDAKIESLPGGERSEGTEGYGVSAGGGQTEGGAVGGVEGGTTSRSMESGLEGGAVESEEGGATSRGMEGGLEGGAVESEESGVKGEAILEGGHAGEAEAGTITEWLEVPGGGMTDVALSAAYFGGQLYLFAKGVEDRCIYVNNMDNSGTWSGWEEVPGGGTTDTALSAAVYGDKLYIFSKGVGDRQIYTNVMDSTAGWSGWAQVPGGGVTDAALSATSFGGRLYLFSKGIEDRRIYMNIMDGSSRWSGWAEVPGGGTTDSSLSSIASRGRLYLFSKGIEDRRIYMNVMDGSGAWYGCGEVPGAGTTDAALSAAAGGDGLCLFSKGVGDRQIYMNVMNESDIWSGWAAVPGGGITDCSPASSATGDRIYIFAKGVEDRRIYMMQAPSSDAISAGLESQVLRTQSEGPDLAGAVVPAASLQQTMEMTARMLPQEQRSYYVRIVALDSNDECIGLPSDGTRVVVGDPGLEQILADPELLTSSDSSPGMIAPWFTVKQLNTFSGLEIFVYDRCESNIEFKDRNWGRGSPNLIGSPQPERRIGWSLGSSLENNFSFAVWQLVGKEQIETPPGSDIADTWRNPEGLLEASLLRTDDADPDIWCPATPKHSFVLDMTKYLPEYEPGNFTKADYYLRVIAMEPTDNPEIYNAYPSEWKNIHYESEPCGGQECPEIYPCDLLSLSVDVPCPDVKIATYEPIHFQDNNWYYHYIVTKEPEWPWSESYHLGQQLDMTPKPVNKSWWDYVTDFFGAIVDAVESIVNWVSQAWKDIKSFAVDIAASATCFGNEDCSNAIRPFVETGLNTGLAAMGIPPEIPNFDQLTSMGKGYLVKTLAAQAGVNPELAEFVITDDNVEAGVDAFIDKSAEPVPGDPLGLKLDSAYQYRPAYLMIELTNRHSVPTLPGTLHISDSLGLFRTEEPSIPFPALDPAETLTVPVFLKEFRYDETAYGCWCPDTHSYSCRCNGPMGELNGVDWMKTYGSMTDTFTVKAECQGTLDIAGMDQGLLPEWVGHCSSPRITYNQIGDNRDELRTIPGIRWST